MNNYTSEKRGTITLGDKVMVSDPCYGLNTWCQGVLENVLPGEYECKVGFADDSIVADIDVTHKDYVDRMLSYEAEEFEVGVDSGQAGIFDYDYYKKYHTDSSERDHVNRYWYNKVCGKTSEYIVNTDYVSFIDLPEYKAALMEFRRELNELHAKYPHLDVNSGYEEKINHYHEMVSDDYSVSVSELTEILKRLNETLSDKNPKKVEYKEGEEELIDINFKYGDILRALFMKHDRSKNGQKKFYRKTGSTIGSLGFVSSSGDGDGSYTCYTAKDNGKVVAIRIEYLTDEDYEEVYNEYGN